MLSSVAILLKRSFFSLGNSICGEIFVERFRQHCRVPSVCGGTTCPSHDYHSRVAQAYYELVALDTELSIVRQTLKAREEGMRLARIRFEGGLTSETLSSVSG